MKLICGTVEEALFLILALDRYEWSALILILNETEGGTTLVTPRIQTTTW
jgi:hypothetical protein